MRKLTHHHAARHSPWFGPRFGPRFGPSLAARLTAFSLAAGLVSGAAPASAGPGEGAFAQQLEPGNWLERCVLLSYGELVAYRFSATVPLSFSVGMPLDADRKRPVAGDAGAAAAAAADMTYALQRDGVVMLALTFRAPLAGNWCWRWSNLTDAGVQLEGNVARVGAGGP
jgi:hypothetical protein